MGEDRDYVADEAAEKIIDIFLALPWETRSRAISAVQYNDIFCWHCGMGSREHPNPDCQCWNDE